MIQKLQAQNLNRRSFDYTLAPLTIVTGDNAAGKSTIADAIKLATLGNVPGYPATNAGIMDNFASGPSLTVAIETARGSFIRSWTRTGKSVKSGSTGDEQIAKDLAPSFLNGEAFLAAKPAARANMLRTAFELEGDPKEIVIEAVGGIAGIQPSKEIIGLPFDEFVAKYLEELAAAASGHRANIKRMKGTIQGITQLDADVVGSSVTKADVAAAREAVTKAAQALGSAEQALRAIGTVAECEKPVQTRENAQAQLMVLEPDAKAKDSALRDGSARYNAELAAYKAGVRMYDDQMSRHTVALQQFEEAASKAAEVEITIQIARQYLEETKAVADGFRELQEKAKLTKELHTAAMGKADVAQAELDTLSAGVSDGCTCQTCGAAKEYWKAEYLKLASEKIEIASRKRDDALEVRSNAAATAAKISEELERSLAVMAKREVVLALVEADEILKENPKPEGGIPVPPPEFDSEKMSAELYEIECQIQEEKDTLDAWDKYEKYIDYLEAKKITEKLVADATAVHAQAQARAEELQAKFDAGAAAAESEAKKKQAEDELTKAEEDLAEVEATADTVKATAAKESEKTLAPLLAIVNTFTKGILTPGISNVGLDIGRWHGAQWQPIARLSGAEKAMVVAALSVALASVGSKIVLIDEFSVIDDKWKPMFLANLREAFDAGKIEQAIVLDNRPIEADGWTAIRLEK